MTKQTFGQYTLDRDLGIGGSDVPVIVGLSPYRSALDLWNEKRGNSIERESSLIQRLGQLLEDGIAKAYAEQENVRLRKRTLPFGVRFVDATLVPDPDLAAKFGFPTWAQIDRERVGDPDVRAVEVKHTANSYRFADGVPDDVQVQVQHGLMLTGWKAAHVVSLSGGRTLKVDTIKADPDVHAAIAAACLKFWRQVVEGVEPEPDGSDAAGRYLRQKYNVVDPGKVIVATPDMKPMLVELLDAKGALDAADKAYEAAKQRIMAFMEDAERIEAAGGLKITWKDRAGSKSWKNIAAGYRRALEQVKPLITDGVMGANTPAVAAVKPILDDFDTFEELHKGAPTRVFDVRGKAVGL